MLPFEEMMELTDLFAFEKEDAKVQAESRASEAVKPILAALLPMLGEVATLPLELRVAAINAMRIAIHGISPFKAEPVDLVIWEPMDSIVANQWNPNKTAPPEQRLLEISILHDGYTQPIVTSWENGKNEVVDGFHRSRVGRESAEVGARVQGYLPIVKINAERADKSDRMAATVRHNRARGKHGVEAMSDMVVELKRRFWSDEKIAKELGMDSDEVLRLQQITGLAGLFADREFSEAWEAESFTGDDEQPAETINESEEN